MVAPRYVIIGSGIAGLAAAEAMRRRVPGAQIFMIGEEPHPFYSRPGLAYLLRGDIPEKQLWIRRPEDLHALQLQRVHARVEQIDGPRHEVILAGGHHLPYDRLLLATGALAATPPFLKGPLQGVVKLDSLDDTRQILQLARRGQTAVVVGGGITALELAEGLQARGLQVHYFLRGDRYWSDVLDETESNIIMERLRHEGVSLHLNTQVKQVCAQGQCLAGVETHASVYLPCHILATAIGVRPRTELAKQAGLVVDKGVVVNQYLQTSMPDVYAAGDVAQVQDAHGRAGTLDVLWPTALAQGRLAGENMTGAQKPYVKGLSFNVTQLGGLKVTIIGSVGGGSTKDLVAIARGDSEAWRLAPKSLVVSGHEDVNRVRLLVSDRGIVGALVMGDQAWSHPLQRLIAEQVDITPIRATLTQGGPESLPRLAKFCQEYFAKSKPGG